MDEKIESLTCALLSKPCQHEGATTSKPVQLATLNNPLAREAVTDPGERDRHVGNKIILSSHQANSQKMAGDTVNLSPHEVQILFNRYTKLMAPHMPFVTLQTPSIIASSFNSSLLLQAIIAVAHFHETTDQIVLVEDLIQQITSRLFTSTERSLDLLQALLVLCTWYNPHLFLSSSHTSLLHLCMSLTTELAIDRDPATCEMAHMAAAMKSCGIPQNLKTINDEERRAVLGVFWLASTVFTSFRKSDVPSWTPWLQQCVMALEDTGLESDKVLVSLVQSQKIMHQAMSAPLLLHHPRVLQTDLDSVDLADPADDVIPTLLTLQRECARIAIYESSFAKRDLEGVWSCVSAITSYLTTYASLPVAAYLTVPFTVFGQFAYVFVVMVRASSVQFDGFDGTLLRELIDFEKIMEQAGEKYEAVGDVKIDGVQVRNGGFNTWAGKCRWAKTFYGMKAKEDMGQAGEKYVHDPAASASGSLDGCSVNDGGWTGADILGGVGIDFSPLDPVFMS